MYWYTVYISFKKSTFVQYSRQCFTQKIQEHNDEYVELNVELDLKKKSFLDHQL